MPALKKAIQAYDPTFEFNKAADKVSVEDAFKLLEKRVAEDKKDAKKYDDKTTGARDNKLAEMKKVANGLTFGMAQYYYDAEKTQCKKFK